MKILARHGWPVVIAALMGISCGAPVESVPSTTSTQPASPADSGASLALAISPNPAALMYGGRTRQFTAMLNGQPTTDVIWSLSVRAGLGTISATGLYQAPADPTSWSTVDIIATSRVNSAAKARVAQSVGPAAAAPPTTPSPAAPITPAPSPQVAPPAAEPTPPPPAQPTPPPAAEPPAPPPAQPTPPPPAQPTAPPPAQPTAPPPPSGANTAQRPAGNTGTGFFVANGKLYDPNGVLFRPVGLNKLHWDSNSPGLFGSNPTRSNTVRWDIDFNQSTDINLALMKKSLDAGQVPMPGSWRGTCDEGLASLTEIVDKWVAQAAAWRTIDNRMLLNIANEWGPPDSTVWRDAYITAIARLRAAGYLAPIVVDAGGCGQDARGIVNHAAAVFQSDPQKNVIFDVHLYGQWINDPANRKMDLNTWMDRMKATGLPVVCGEFGPGKNIGPSPTMLTPGDIIQACSARDFGWLAWAWDDPDGQYTPGGCDDSWFCMSRTGGYTGSSDLTVFGRDVVENPTYGIKATARKATIFP